MMDITYKVADQDSIVKLRRGSHWVKKRINDIKVKELFAFYNKIEVPVDDVYGVPFTLMLTDYETYLLDWEGTVDDWLGTLGGSSLKLTNNYPSLKLRTANYLAGMWDIGEYSFAATNAHPSHDIPHEDRADIIVNLNTAKNKLLHSRCLLSVNGFTVKTNLHDYGMRIINGGNIIRKSTDVSFGITNFEEIGDISYLPITESMVKKIGVNKSLYTSVIINTKTDLTNKTVGLVLGGYLHLLDGFVTVTGLNTVTISMGQLDLLPRWIESKDYLDLTFLPLEQLEFGVSSELIQRDDMLMAYITSEHSFLVFIDNPEMSMTKLAVDNATINFRYTVPESQLLAPMHNDLGRGMEYWPRYECGTWSLNVNTDHIFHYGFEDTGWQHQHRINDNLDTRCSVSRAEPRMYYYEARIK